MLHTTEISEIRKMKTYTLREIIEKPDCRYEIIDGLSDGKITSYINLICSDECETYDELYSAIFDAPELETAELEPIIESATQSYSEVATDFGLYVRNYYEFGEVFATAGGRLFDIGTGARLYLI